MNPRLFEVKLVEQWDNPNVMPSAFTLDRTLNVVVHGTAEDAIAVAKESAERDAREEMDTFGSADEYEEKGNIFLRVDVESVRPLDDVHVIASSAIAALEAATT